MTSPKSSLAAETVSSPQIIGVQKDVLSEQPSFVSEVDVHVSHPCDPLNETPARAKHRLSIAESSNDFELPPETQITDHATKDDPTGVIPRSESFEVQSDHADNALQVEPIDDEKTIGEYDQHDATDNHSHDFVRTPSHRISCSTLCPSPASDRDSLLDLSASTASSVSSISGRSISSQPSEAGFTTKKRGYMRPQATNFSESAKSRESVLNLGSIAHLQYYFARTGLLDGKGGQFARKTSEARAASFNASRNSSGEHDRSVTADGSGTPDRGTTPEHDAEWEREFSMLPPTVSTYNQKPAYIQPPPDLTMLRRELTESLENALKCLKETDPDDNEDDAQGWYEIQGLHLLDVITLAIRAAKNYYTAHSQYQRLHAIKSERAIRRELYQVLEILKRMATRNFAGGLRQNEKVEILTWIVGISELIQTEIDEEKREVAERERWSWRHGDWTGREREREHAFMKCFVNDPESLPEWSQPAAGQSDDGLVQPTKFLQYFQDGLQLVQLHNASTLR